MLRLYSYRSPALLALLGAISILVCSSPSLLVSGLAFQDGSGGCRTATAASEDQLVSTARGGFLFLSPNTRENLTPAEASQQLRTDEHVRFRKLVDDILGQIGLSNHWTFDSIGDWSDGVENSIYVEIGSPTHLAALGYAAARFGLQAGQRSVLVCRADPQGAGSIYELDVAEPGLVSLRAALDRHGLRFRTLIPKDFGHRVVIFDANRLWRTKITELAAVTGSSLKETRATGEYLGADDVDEARKLFRHVIRNYEAGQRPPAMSLIR